MTQRRIDYLPLAELQPAKRNPKRHDLAAIRRSVARLGYTAPMVLDERTGRLVIGHGRREALIAMRDAGAEPPDGVRVEGDAWLVPVVRGWQSATDGEADAAAVADNRLTELGGWDDAELAEMVAGLDAELALLAAGNERELAGLEKQLQAAAPPDAFPAVGDDIATEYRCPRCGHEWSGSAK